MSTYWIVYVIAAIIYGVIEMVIGWKDVARKEYTR